MTREHVELIGKFKALHNVLYGERTEDFYEKHHLLQSERITPKLRNEVSGMEKFLTDVYAQWRIDEAVRAKARQEEYESKQIMHKLQGAVLPLCV